VSYDELSGAVWRKSSWSSGGESTCVEVALGAPVVGIRDTKDRDGGTLVVTPATWSAFRACVAAK